MKSWPKNPRPPVPEFVTADVPDRHMMAYGWKCLKHGIIAFGDTKDDAIARWTQAYRDEYGITS